jgi:4'-phosphopantetheinyl transferase EntD
MQDAVLRGIQQDIARVLPPGAVFSLGRVVEPAPPLRPAEIVAAERMAPPRLREFAAGRHRAREALALLGVAPVDLPVGRDRSPGWPAGTVGSISHAAGLVLAVAARTDRLAAIGADLEPADPLESGLVRRICRPEELAVIAGRTEPGRHARLVFSAKESVYKCIAPLAGVFLEFEDVEIVWRNDHRFAARGHGRGATVLANAAVRGAFVESGGFWITAAWQAAAPP